MVWSIVGQEIDRFAMGLGKWLKVAGDEKASILSHSIGSRKLTEHKTMVEFGSFVGYTATRMGRQVELAYLEGYEDGSILFEDSRLQGANRITSMEIDPVAVVKQPGKDRRKPGNALFYHLKLH